MNRNAWAWLAMIVAVALHVVDETVHDFLAFYNPMVLDLKDSLGFFPAPTFTFPVWLGGLVAGIAVGLFVTPLIARGGSSVRVASVALSVLMVINALLHLGGSLYLGRMIPGVISSPLLLVASLAMLKRGLRDSW